MTTTSGKHIGAIVLAACCLTFIAGITSASAPAADKFKSFKLKTLDGTKKTLQDLESKVTLIAFYYPTCAYCNLALPEVLKIYETYKDRGLSYVIINVKPDEEKLIPGWQEKYHVTVPVLVAVSQDALMDDYHLTITPTHCLLGSKGEVLLRQNGYNRGDEKTLEAKIAEALGIAIEQPTPEKR
jgi:peroxiredoxin